MTDPTPAEIDLDAIEARAEAATKGPWHVEYFGNQGYPQRIGNDAAILVADTHEGGEGLRPTPEFIAAARTDVPALVAEVRRLRAEAAIAFWPGLYFEIQQVLDKALGTKEVDGAGEGIVADVALLADRLAKAEAKTRTLIGDLAAVARHIEDGEYGDADKAARQALGIAPGVDLPGRES